MRTAQKIWKSSEGYKTRTGAVLLAIYEFINLISPELLAGKAGEVTRQGINLLIITGGADWVWRNRHSIINTLKKLTKWKKEKDS